MAASGDFDNYRCVRKEIIARFGGTSDPGIAGRSAETCLILPDSGADLDVVAQLADTAAAATNHRATPWFQLVKGLADYRQESFNSAVEWLNKTLMEPGEPQREVAAYMVLAMAHFRLKQADEARAAFERGVKIEQTELPKLESGDIGEGWVDWIIAHALMDQAKKELIESDSSTPTTPR
jgi:tetratricopeptide (TPR) repeat protein